MDPRSEIQALKAEIKELKEKNQGLETENQELKKQLEGIGITENKELATALLALITANQSTIRANTELITALDTRITEYQRTINATITTTGKTTFENNIISS